MKHTTQLCNAIKLNTTCTKYNIYNKTTTGNMESVVKITLQKKKNS